MSRGLPEKVSPLRMYACRTGTGHVLYLTTLDSGVFSMAPGNASWKNITSSDFRKRSIYSKEKKFRKISAFSADPDRPGHLALATKHSLYRSYNSGRTWTRMSMRGLGRKAYITALSLKNGRLLAGTSFNGVYRHRNGRFHRWTQGLPGEPYSSSLVFTEEISCISQDSAGTAYAGTAFGRGAFYANHNSGPWVTAGIPLHIDSFSHVYDIIPCGNTLLCVTDSLVMSKTGKTGKWTRLDLSIFKQMVPEQTGARSLVLVDNTGALPALCIPLKSRKSLSAPAHDRRALYASVPAVRKRTGSLIKTITGSGFNAIVIDMKDDFGNIYFPTRNSTAREISAARRPLPVRAILGRLKDAGIYTIARIVVFKDERLFRAFNSRYAISNTRTNRPWKGNPREYWVDPHSVFVHDYNISLALELEALGFDEIQFDYIRFPSDGPTHLCGYPHRKDSDTYKSEILADFLMKAAGALKIPISTDIYGFNSWYHFGNWIGQDMEEFSRIVDVICPMVYPSHFGSRFYMSGKRELRPYRIVHDGGRRSVKLIHNRIPVRPYLQAFRLRSPTWGNCYIRNQAEAAEKSGCSGYTYWNARGDYAIIRRAFRNRKGCND